MSLSPPAAPAASAAAATKPPTTQAEAEAAEAVASMNSAAPPASSSSAAAAAASSSTAPSSSSSSLLGVKLFASEVTARRPSIANLLEAAATTSSSGIADGAAAKGASASDAGGAGGGLPLPPPPAAAHAAAAAAAAAASPATSPQPSDSFPQPSSSYYPPAADVYTSDHYRQQSYSTYPSQQSQYPTATSYNVFQKDTSDGMAPSSSAKSHSMSSAYGFQQPAATASNIRGKPKKGSVSSAAAAAAVVSYGTDSYSIGESEPKESNVRGERLPLKHGPAVSSAASTSQPTITTSGSRSEALIAAAAASGVHALTGGSAGPAITFSMPHISVDSMGFGIGTPDSDEEEGPHYMNAPRAAGAPLQGNGGAPAAGANGAAATASTANGGLLGSSVLDIDDDDLPGLADDHPSRILSSLSTSRISSNTSPSLDTSKHIDDGLDALTVVAASSAPAPAAPAAPSHEEYDYDSNQDKLSKPYACKFPDCPWSFARKSDQRRHLRSHENPTFHCPYWQSDPTCHRNGGSFNRLDVLKRHLKLVHFVQFKQSESGWCRTCEKIFNSPKHFVEHCEKCAESIRPQNREVRAPQPPLDKHQQEQIELEENQKRQMNKLRLQIQQIDSNAAAARDGVRSTDDDDDDDEDDDEDDDRGPPQPVHIGSTPPNRGRGGPRPRLAFNRTTTEPAPRAIGDLRARVTRTRVRKQYDSRAAEREAEAAAHATALIGAKAATSTLSAFTMKETAKSASRRATRYSLDFLGNNGGGSNGNEDTTATTTTTTSMAVPAGLNAVAAVAAAAATAGVGAAPLSRSSQLDMGPFVAGGRAVNSATVTSLRSTQAEGTSYSGVGAYYEGQYTKYPEGGRAQSSAATTTTTSPLKQRHADGEDKPQDEEDAGAGAAHAIISSGAGASAPEQQLLLEHMQKEEDMDDVNVVTTGMDSITRPLFGEHDVVKQEPQEPGAAEEAEDTVKEEGPGDAGDAAAEQADGDEAADESPAKRQRLDAEPSSQAAAASTEPAESSGPAAIGARRSTYKGTHITVTGPRNRRGGSNRHTLSGTTQAGHHVSRNK